MRASVLPLARSVSLAGSVALAVALCSGVALAQAPVQQKTQVPGYFRLAVGDYEVTALFDGYNDLSPKLLKGMKPDAIRALLARRAIETPGMQTAFNAFLVITACSLQPEACCSPHHPTGTIPTANIGVWF